ncbi:hypothetical protein DPMN_112291 [Dreissena polymorpha]|uniref:Uncharacterized protein n=1 Tax=Dreissena polymorpha TaxID=45954 RepID=A0A9D4QPS3_DREPO|nr:hypothetical protein DPMN_112291 [Dreissena polymorpha]
MRQKTPPGDNQLNSHAPGAGIEPRLPPTTALLVWGLNQDHHQPLLYECGD